MVTPWRAARAIASSRCSCQMPKLEPVPPVLVRLVEPLPEAGVHADGHVVAGKRRAEAVELMQRAGVVAHAALDELAPARATASAR